jgi:predicted Zn-dependent peptidase
VEKLAKRLVVVRGGEFPTLPEIKEKTMDEVEKRSELNQANIAMGIHFPCRSQRERYVAEVFSTILGQGMSSRLFTEVREKKGLVYAVKTELDLGKNYGYMIIFAGTEDSKIDEVYKICKEEYKKMQYLTEKELEEGKIQVIGMRRVESEGSNETAVSLLVEEITNNASNYYKYSDNINQVNLEDIKKLAGLSQFSTFTLTKKD